jgi:ribonuclease HI
MSAHPNPPHQIPCPHCEKKFKKVKDLRAHFNKTYGIIQGPTDPRIAILQPTLSQRRLIVCPGCSRFQSVNLDGEIRTHDKPGGLSCLKIPKPLSRYVAAEVLLATPLTGDAAFPANVPVHPSIPPRQRKPHEYQPAEFTLYLTSHRLIFFSDGAKPANGKLDGPPDAGLGTFLQLHHQEKEPQDLWEACMYLSGDPIPETNNTAEYQAAIMNAQYLLDLANGIGNPKAIKALSTSSLVTFVVDSELLVKQYYTIINTTCPKIIKLRNCLLNTLDEAVKVKPNLEIEVLWTSRCYNERADARSKEAVENQTTYQRDLSRSAPSSLYSEPTVNRPRRECKSVYKTKSPPPSLPSSASPSPRSNSYNSADPSLTRILRQDQHKITIKLGRHTAIRLSSRSELHVDDLSSSMSESYIPGTPNPHSPPSPSQSASYVPGTPNQYSIPREREREREGETEKERERGGERETEGDGEREREGENERERERAPHTHPILKTMAIFP